MSSDFDPWGRLRIAHHEAGHAVVTWAFGIPLREVVADELDGYAQRAEENDALGHRAGEKEMHRIAGTILLAEEAAQKKSQPKTEYLGCAEDLRFAQHAERTPGSADESVIAALLGTWLDDARRLIDTNWLCKCNV